VAGLTYKDAGVDVEAGDAFVSEIGPIAAATSRPEVLGRLGGFAGLCNIPDGYEDPVLVAGTDGVGTKLKVAFLADRHDTVGIDLVAMCVNDILCCGAEPLFFLDYFGTGQLSPQQGVDVVRGIAEGCKQSGCALLGGETAELPGFYSRGEYDLAGFAVGVVERSSIVDGSRIAPGHVLVGLPSNGLHSNGYSLARKALLGRGEDEKWLDTLLTPTRIYAPEVKAAMRAGGVDGMAHITGGGIAGNLSRILPDTVTGRLWMERWTRPEIFHAIQKAGDVAESEMDKTFNLGLGMILVVAPDAVEGLLSVLQTMDPAISVVGEVEAGDGSVVIERGNV